MKKKATFKSLSELYKLHHPKKTSDDFLNFAFKMDFAIFIHNPSRTIEENEFDRQFHYDYAEYFILLTSQIISNYKLKKDEIK